MKVLLTGGTGFVGAWTAQALVEAGHQVRFLVRDPARLATSVVPLGVRPDDVAVGDIADAGAVRDALTGCDAVVHAAAVVALGPADAERMARTNLAGARHVLGQAAELGLDPLIHVSSVAALFGPGLERISVDLPVTDGVDAYGVSKAQVERYVRGLQDDGAPVAITYPAMVLGPPAGTQMGEAVDGVRVAVRMRVIPGRRAGWSVIDVRDLARVHAALLEPGRGPRRYVVGGVWLDAAGVADALRVAGGRGMLRVPVPDAWLRGLGRAWDVSRLERLGLHSKVTGPAMEYYTRMVPCDPEPVRRDLGVTYRDPVRTLTETVAGLRASGLLPGGAPSPSTG